MREAAQSNVLSGTGAYATLADLIALRHKAHRLALPRNQTATNQPNDRPATLKASGPRDGLQ